LKCSPFKCLIRRMHKILFPEPSIAQVNFDSEHARKRRAVAARSCIVIYVWC
jgi:hypothetical protein